jgi:RNA polymerase sigma-70 factor (ECF subfamily)
MKMDEQDIGYQLNLVKNKVYRLALTLMKHREDAQDIAQEAMMRIWDHREKMQEIRNLEAYAMTITKNLSLDRIKVNKTKRMVELDETNAGVETLTPFSSVSFANLRDLMLQLFSTLPEQQRMIIHLRDIEHYSYEEIESITGLTVNTIRVNLSRARKNVRSSYKKIKSYENR